MSGWHLIAKGTGTVCPVVWNHQRDLNRALFDEMHEISESRHFFTFLVNSLQRERLLLEAMIDGLSSPTLSCLLEKADSWLKKSLGVRLRYDAPALSNA